MKLSKKILFTLLFICLSATSLEVLIYTSLWATNQLPTSSFAKIYEQRAQKKIGLGNSQQFNTSWSTVRPHPYFGYVLTGGNNHGFLEENDFPYQKKENEFIVGVFGGSVAWDFGHRKGSRLLAEGLKKEISFLKNKTVRILNFAMGAYKQPQTFFVASYFSPSFDLAINLDGYNEIRSRLSHETPSYKPEDRFPEEFPAFSEIFFSRDQSHFIKFGQSYYQSQFLKNYSRFALSSFIFRNSSTVYASFRIINSFFEKEKIKVSTTQNHKNSKTSKIWSKEEIDKRIRTWEKYTKLQSETLKRDGIKSVFFIQPSMDNKNSKPLSFDEKQLSQNQDFINYITRGYQAIEQSAEKLNKEGIKVYSLSQVFKSHKGTLYRDSCHLFEEGGEIIAKEMIRIIKKHKVLSSR